LLYGKDFDAVTMMSQRTKTTFESGFTLLETSIASLILLFALATMLALSAQGFRYIGDMRRWARSSQVLQEKMENIRLITRWESLMALNNSTFSDASLPGLACRGTITVAPYPPYPTNIAACVTVTVTWTNASRRVVTNRLTSVVCQNGLNKYIF